MTKNDERGGYHHGDLRRVLLETAVALLNERGVEGFRLREVARRANVAPAAPSHHFSNVSGLLTAVAADGFKRLATAFEEARATKAGPFNQSVALCETYVRFCLDNPGTASIMFRWELLDDDDDALATHRPETLRLLTETVRAALPEGASLEKTDAVAKTLWATMHGLVTLKLDAPEATLRQAAFAAQSVIVGAGK